MIYLIGVLVGMYLVTDMVFAGTDLYAQGMAVTAIYNVCLIVVYAFIIGRAEQ